MVRDIRSAAAEKRPPAVARLERGNKDPQPIPTAAAAASTAGSRLVGGCCQLVGPDRFRLLADDQKDWPLLGPPQPGQAWRMALASPDQQWIAVQASTDGAQAQELWLIKVEKR